MKRRGIEGKFGFIAAGLCPAAALLVLVAFSAAHAEEAPAPLSGFPDTRIEVDLQLVMGSDVSGSVSHSEAFLQRKGVADAFRHREVITAIENGGLGRIAVTYVDWSSRFYNQTLVSWTMIDSEEAAIAFANTLMTIPRTQGQGTSISDMLEYSAALFEISPFYGGKRVIDVSGDGPNRSGRPLLEVRDEVVARGIIINGLPIIDPYGWDEFANLGEYFEGCVIGGPGAFVQVAEGFADFSRAIRRKLVLELSGMEPHLLPNDAPPLIRTQSVPLPPAPNLQPLTKQYDGPCDTWDFYR